MLPNLYSKYPCRAEKKAECNINNTETLRLKKTFSERGCCPLNPLPEYSTINHYVLKVNIKFINLFKLFRKRFNISSSQAYWFKCHFSSHIRAVCTFLLLSFDFKFKKYLQYSGNSDIQQIMCFIIYVYIIYDVYFKFYRKSRNFFQNSVQKIINPFHSNMAMLSTKHSWQVLSL